MKFLLPIFTLTAMLGCDGAVRESGVVTTDDNKPIEGAEVSLKQIREPGEKLDPREITVVTAKDGKYSVGFTHAPGILGSSDLVLTVKKAGFKTHREKIAPNTHLSNHNIRLETVRKKPK